MFTQARFARAAALSAIFALSATVSAKADPLALIQIRFHQAAKQCQGLPPSEKHALVQRLIVIARTDKELREEEKAVLGQVCQALGINPLFVEQMLMMTG